MQGVRILLVLFLASMITASASPENVDLVKRELVVRQDSSTSSKGQGEPILGEVTTSQTSPDNPPEAPSTDKSSNSASKSDEPSGSKTSDNQSQETPAPSESGSKESKTASTDASTITSKPKSTRIPATAQVGYVTMKQPAATDGYPLYKIGETVTFEWTYSALVVTPSHINVVAHCSEVAGDFTIAKNISASETKVEWDTGNAQRNSSVKLPLAATYTLNIYDSEMRVSDNARPGHLQPYAGTQFGMYAKREYKHRDEFVCPTCDPNMANGIDKYTIRMMITMGLIAAISFIWFISGASI